MSAPLLRNGVAFAQAAAARNLAALATAGPPPAAPTLTAAPPSSTDEALPSPDRDRAWRATAAARESEARARAADAAAEKSLADARAALVFISEHDDLSPRWSSHAQHAARGGVRTSIEKAVARRAAARTATADAIASADAAIHATTPESARIAADTADAFADSASKASEDVRTASVWLELVAHRVRGARYVTQARSAVTSALAAVRAVDTVTPDDPAPHRTRVRRTLDIRALTDISKLLGDGAARNHADPTGLLGLRAGADLFAEPADARVARRDPGIAYAFACYLVRWRGVEFADVTVAELFGLSFDSDVALRFLPIDPELVTARDRAGFLKLVERAEAELERRAAAAKSAKATTTPSGTAKKTDG